MCVSHLHDVPYDQLPYLHLHGLPAPDDVEGLLALYPVLQSPELPLLGPVVEGSHQHHDDHGDQDGHALDPLGVLLLLLA